MQYDQLTLQEIENIASEKEKEWHSAATLQIKKLQEAFLLKTKLHDDMSGKFTQLKDDFKYNLKLLQERDKELKISDEVHRALKINESKLLCEISDLRIKADNVNEALCLEKQIRDEMEIHYKQRLMDQHTELEILRTSKNKEVDEVLNELRKTKHHYEHKLTGLQCELESQKAEFDTELESLMKEKESQQLEKDAKYRNKCTVLEMKNKLLRKEIDVCREKEKEQKEIADNAVQQMEDFKSKLQKAEWELTDMSSLKNARILELESQVGHLQLLSKKIEQDFEERRMHLDKDIRSKQANLMAAKQSSLDREKGFDEEIRKLHSQLELSKLETSRAIWDHNETKSTLNEVIEQHKSEVDKLSEKLELTMVEKSKCVVARDAEIMMLKKREDLLKVENYRLKNDIEKYKKEISDSVHREESVKQSKLQLKLDLKRKCEDAESSAFVKAEDFATNLSKSRDHAIAETTKWKNELKETKLLLDATSRDRDAAIAVLQKHHLTPEFENLLLGSSANEFHGANIASAHIQDLLKQNSQLKSVVQQMTDDMQDLQARKRQVIGGEDENANIENYTKSLEKENLELKREKRRLEDKLSEAKGADVQQPVLHKDKDANVEISLNHPKIQEHMRSLNQKLATLESEKIDLRAQLQKLQTNLDHHLVVAQKQSQEAQAASTKIQQLEFEATATKHRTDQEIKRFKNEISTLSLRFQEARSEADEYYRGGIQNNMRVMELSEKVSQMTIDVASDTPWVTGSAQAKLVQDLQSQVTQLQKQLHHANRRNPSSPNAKPSTDATASVLQRKLRVANERIKNLVRERSMLLESGNKMRMELNDLKERERRQPELTPLREEEGGDGKLDKMEKLQYDLTKQELAFAQRFALPQTDDRSADMSSGDSFQVSAPVTSSTLRNRAEKPMMMSSIDDASMKDVWQMLEQAPSSPSIASEGIPVRSEAPPIAKKETSNRPIKKPASLSKRRVAKPNTKIRNYNVKDDAIFRTKK